MSKLYFKYHSNGNLENVTTEGNHLYQGMVGIADYHLSMADPEDVNNILPSDVVLLCFERPDGKTGAVRMAYDNELNLWSVVTNGWETDVDIAGSNELKVSFEGRRYSMISETVMVRKFTSSQAVLIIQPSSSYVPLGLADPIIDGILEDIGNIEQRVDESETDIQTLQSQMTGKLDKLTNDAFYEHAYTHTGATQSQRKISESATLGGTLVLRNPVGAIYINTAHETEPYHAMSIGNAENKISAAIAGLKRGEPNGVATLDSGGKIPSGQLPSYVDDVIEVASYPLLPSPGESGKIYVTLDTNLTYRWSGSAYIEISKSLALGETSTTAYRGDRGAAMYDFLNASLEAESLNALLRQKVNYTDSSWVILTVIDNAAIIIVTDHKNYKLTNNQNIALTIQDEYNGAHMLVAVHGGVALTLPPECVTDVAFDWTTVEDDSQYYIYEFMYNGTVWEVTRNVYPEA